MSPFFEPARPLPADGIRAKSRRGAIGEQWWSRRFIAVLESVISSGRLTRGRNYARSGQVLEFALSPGAVTARVQGSRPTPYRVHLQVDPLTDSQWDAVEQRLNSQALFRAKLLAGEMPHEIEEVFASCGTPLFPATSDDLGMDCDCPDWQVPCKHLAAVCYVLAEAFDSDPFGMLAWRGRGRDALLADLRPAPASFSIDVPGVPLEDCLDDFWSPARLRPLPVTPSAAPDLLLRLFDPPAVTLAGRPLRDVLAPAYQQLAEHPGGLPPAPPPAPPPGPERTRRRPEASSPGLTHSGHPTYHDIAGGKGARTREKMRGRQPAGLGRLPRRSVGAARHGLPDQRGERQNSMEGNGDR
jgi:uncharacterized Zn finger protein